MNPELLENIRAKWATNKALLTAYRKGWDAEEGTSCPYQDKRGGAHQQVITYSRAFRAFWFEGYEDSRKGYSRYIAS